MSTPNLAWSFWQNSRLYPERPAIVGERSLTYGEAAAGAARVAAWLGERAATRVAILASRSEAACLAVLGAAWAGVTYIPLSLKLPEQRLMEVLGQARADALLVDARGELLLTPAVRQAAPLHLLRPDAQTLPPPGRERPAEVDPRGVAYIIFTSGTTGVPKGVMIHNASVSHLIQVAQERFPLTPEDRVGENFELSFDASVFDMFLAWNAGATLYLIPPAQALAPLAFLRRHRLTMCVLAPASVAFARSLKALRPDSLPDLRWSLFGAEALSLSAAREWQAVAPQSALYSLYGPTENTVTSLAQALTEPPLVTPERDNIALGKPLRGIGAAVLGPDLGFLPPGQSGQIALSGPQLAAGYLDDPELTARRFPHLAGERWYLSGDRGYQDEAGIFHHLGRLDHQVKILGHRVELEEVESYLRAATGQPDVAALAWSPPGQPARLIAFVGPAAPQPPAVQAQLRSMLPGYALPARVIRLERLPCTENGKVDRNSLRAWLDTHG